MAKISNPRLTPNAQRLRREMTKEERRLWYDFLKLAGIQAHRQKTIGPYIVDFYIAAMCSSGYFGADRRMFRPPSGRMSFVEPPPPMARMLRSSSMMQML